MVDGNRNPTVSNQPGLGDLHHQTLEVFSFRMEQTHWMIGSLAQTVKDFCFTPELHGRRSDGVVKESRIHNLRTGKSKEQTTGFDLFHRRHVDPLVRLNRIVRVRSILLRPNLSL